MPGGRFMPAVRPAILACVAASALATASFIAAMTRSSSMSLSSPSRLGSIDTFFTLNLQVIVAFTRPAPACPSTSMLASSSCAFFRFSCICCACFISAPKPPFGIIASPLLARFAGRGIRGRTNGGRHHLGAEVAHDLAHEWVFLDGAGGVRTALRLVARSLRGHARAACGAGADREAETRREIRRDLALQLVDVG